MYLKSHRILQILSSILVIAAMLLGLGVTLKANTPARAASLIVENLDDHGPGSLRYAIAYAAPGDTITFKPGLTGIIQLTSDRLTINKPMFIKGPGADLLTVSGSNKHQVFFVAEEIQAEISGLTISDGYFKQYPGGGVENHGLLRLKNVVVTKNKADSAGGGIFNASEGQMEILYSTISNNLAPGVQGDVYGANGGGVWNDGIMVVAYTEVSGNTADLFGGGLYNNSTGTLLIRNSKILNNRTTGVFMVYSGGGGIFNNGGTNGTTDGGLLSIDTTLIDGNASTSIASFGGGIANSSSGYGEIYLNKVTVSHNWVKGAGGGISATGFLNILDSTIDSNEANGQNGVGGGMSTGGGVENPGTVNLIRSIISNNKATGYGGGWQKVYGVATVLNSTITGNSANVDGGGILSMSHATNLTNTTIANNIADADQNGSGKGGGLFLQYMEADPTDSPPPPADPNRLDMPKQPMFPTGMYPTYVKLQNTILGNNQANTGNECATISIEPDVPTAYITSLGNNLIENPLDCNLDGDTDKDITGEDPDLAPLHNNGGPTLTLALNLASPAIDAGTAAVCPPRDQRGATRPFDGDNDGTAACDIGAYEVILGPNPQNQAPMANDQLIEGSEDAPLNITLTGADPEDDPLTFSVVSQPANGQVTGPAPAVVYTPNPDFFGIDTFTFQVEDSFGGKDTAVVTVLVNSLPEDLMVTKSDSDDPVLAGAELTYTLTATNKGPSDAFEVILQDTLPDGLSVVSASPECGESAPQSSVDVVCELGTIKAGDEVHVTITTKVGVEVSGTITNTVEVVGKGDDPNPDNNIASETTKVLPGLWLYENDFEGSVNSEWSKSGTDRTPSGRGFLGEFGNEDVTLKLSNLIPHNTAKVSFDLFLIRSWDGNQVDNTLQPFDTITGPNTTVGPDQWAFKVDGKSLLNTSFSNWQILGYHQAFPGNYPTASNRSMAGSVEQNTLGYDYKGIPMSAVYRMTFTVPHNAKTLQLDFSGIGLQATWDESWGIDNIQVVLSSGANLEPQMLYLPVTIGN